MATIVQLLRRPPGYPASPTRFIAKENPQRLGLLGTARKSCRSRGRRIRSLGHGDSMQQPCSRNRIDRHRVSPGQLAGRYRHYQQVSQRKPSPSMEPECQSLIQSQETLPNDLVYAISMSGKRTSQPANKGPRLRKKDKSAPPIKVRIAEKGTGPHRRVRRTKSFSPPAHGSPMGQYPR